MTEKADWIAVDWGTSNLRAWLIAADGSIIRQVGSDKGMGALAPDQFEPTLLEIVAPFLGDNQTKVICCGMVGAKQGWQEAAYATVPCTPAHPETAIHVQADPRLDVHILAGVCQDSPADVMRGEETQIAGFLAENPEFDGVLCLPGTHTKWAQVSAGEIVSFRTFMTGEMFALLSKNSVLLHSVSTDDWNDIEFENAVTDTIGSPQMVAARLFGLRAETLLRDLPNAHAKARLSGMLIGLELAGCKPYWLGQRIAIIGAPGLSALYAAGLRTQGVSAELADGEKMTLAGLTAAYNQMIGQS